MTTRTEFIAALAGTAAALPAATGSRKAPKKKPFDFNRARFDAILAKSALHKQCFGSKKIEGGTVLYAMQNSMKAYEDFYDETPGAMHAVAVLYHGAAIAMAMSNTVWNELLFPLIEKLPAAQADIRKEFQDAAPGKGNPYLAKNLLPHMVAQGCSFFVCHNAIAGFAGLAASTLKHPYEAVHRELMNGIVPGALAVPAGVMAINACQEAKFTYIATN